MTNQSTFRFRGSFVGRLARYASRVTLVASLFAISSSSVKAQASSGLAGQRVDAKTRKELETAREAVWRAWFAGDSAALERLIPKVLAAGAAGQWEDRAATFEGSRKSAASGRRLVSIRFDSTTIDLRNEVALMRARFTYVLEASWGTRTTISGTAAEIFVRENGRWVNPFWYLK